MSIATRWTSCWPTGAASITPPEQPCCGSLHAHNGETRVWPRRLARHNIDLFPPDDSMRSSRTPAAAGRICGTTADCLATIHATPSVPANGIARSRTSRSGWRTSAAGRRTAAPFDEPTTITYHESCHLAHGQKVTKEPRTLLRLLPDTSLVELPESTWCCGSAGVYTITQPDQADLLLKRKTGNILSTRATVVATANPGCQLQVARGLKDAGSVVDVVHPMTLLARDIGEKRINSKLKSHKPNGRRLWRGSNRWAGPETRRN